MRGGQWRLSGSWSSAPRITAAPRLASNCLPTTPASVSATGTAGWSSRPARTFRVAGRCTPTRRPCSPNACRQVAEHESIQLSPALIARADLVLTATRQHRSAVVSSLPAAIGRTFTILQFARLCDEVPPISDSDTGDLGQELVVQAKLARSSVQPVPGEAGRSARPDGTWPAGFSVVRRPPAELHRPNPASADVASAKRRTLTTIHRLVTGPSLRALDTPVAAELAQ